MAHPNPPPKPREHERSQLEDDRADWSRPGLHRLSVNEADTHPKVSRDGALGKGDVS
jgi:hypothetical protein